MRDKRGYYTINVSDHPFRDKRNRAYEHRVILEKYLSEKYNMTIFILPYFDVHHIDGDKTNDNPLNLTYLCRREHTIVDNYKDMSGRICSICKSSKTRIHKKNNRPNWTRDGNGGFLCMNCYRNKKRREGKK